MLGPFIAYSVLYAMIMFVAALAISSTPMAAVPLFAGVGATIFLVAAWSVLGSGSYLRRFAIAHLIGAIPAIGILGGFLLLALSEGAASPGGLGNIFFFAITFLLTLIPISVGAQLPFWFFRSLFGWQFAPKRDAPVASFSLRDIFIITFVFAACFGAAQISANLQMHQFGWFMESTTDYVPVVDANGDPVLDANGFPEYEYVELTGDELQQHRRQEALGIQNRSFMMFGFSIFAALIGSSLSIPILTSLFFSKDLGTGCLITGGYVFAGVILLIGVSTGLGGVRAFVVEAFFWIGATMFCYALAVWLPLMTMREQGIRLTSPKRFERELAQTNKVDKTKEVSAVVESNYGDEDSIA